MFLFVISWLCENKSIIFKCLQELSEGRQVLEEALWCYLCQVGDQDDVMSMWSFGVSHFVKYCGDNFDTMPRWVRVSCWEQQTMFDWNISWLTALQNQVLLLAESQNKPKLGHYSSLTSCRLSRRRKYCSQCRRQSAETQMLLMLIFISFKLFPTQEEEEEEEGGEMQNKIIQWSVAERGATMSQILMVVVQLCPC